MPAMTLGTVWESFEPYTDAIHQLFAWNGCFLGEVLEMWVWSMWGLGASTENFCEAYNCIQNYILYRLYSQPVSIYFNLENINIHIDPQGPAISRVEQKTGSTLGTVMFGQILIWRCLETQRSCEAPKLGYCIHPQMFIFGSKKQSQVFTNHWVLYPKFGIFGKPM